MISKLSKKRVIKNIFIMRIFIISLESKTALNKLATNLNKKNKLTGTKKTDNLDSKNHIFYFFKKSFLGIFL